MQFSCIGILWALLLNAASSDAVLIRHGSEKMLMKWKLERNRRSLAPANISDSLIPIRVAVILPTEGPFLFRQELVRPAVEYAVQSIEREIAAVGYKFEIIYRDSFCNRRAALAAVDLYYGDDTMDERLATLPIQKEEENNNELIAKDQDTDRSRRSTRKEVTLNAAPDKEHPRDRNLPLVFLGPACNEATSFVATFAESWNVPLITSGSGWITTGEEYPTLTRVSPNHDDFAHFVATVFQTLQYGTRVPIHLIYEEILYGPSTERECYYVLNAIVDSLSRYQGMVVADPIYIYSHDFDEIRVMKELIRPKVVLMCASSDIVRRIMIAAHTVGFADPADNIWYAIDLHNSTHYENGGWKRGDADDEVAKEAFRSLHVITLYSSRTTRFNNFVWKMNKKYKKAGISQKGRVNEFVVGFHDAVLLYAYAFIRTLAQGKSVRDGLAISANMKNTTINGIAGPVVMGADGDRHGDYSILVMDDVGAGTFSSVYDYLGSFKMIYNKGMPKLNLTKESRTKNFTINPFGADLNAILAEQEKVHRFAASTTQHEILAGILGTFAGMLLCCMLIFFPMCYQRKRKSRTTTSENGNGLGQFLNGNSDQVCLHRPLREEGSVTTCTTTLDEDQKL